MYRISKQSRWNRLLISAISVRFWSLSYSSFDFCPGCWNAVYTRLRLRCSWFFPFIHLLFRECLFVRFSSSCVKIMVVGLTIVSITYVLLKDSTNWRFEKITFRTIETDGFPFILLQLFTVELAGGFCSMQINNLNYWLK